MFKIFMFLVIFFIGCEKKQQSKIENNLTIKIAKQKKDNITIIAIDNLKLIFKNNKLIFPANKVVILFTNNNTYSKTQEDILKKLNIKYYKTSNIYLEKYFKIEYHPTIVVLDKNKSIIYENLTPYEILKAEGF